MYCNQSTCIKLWSAAKECREAQRRYFKTRSTSDLREAKALERELDKEIATFDRVVNHGGTIPAEAAIAQPELFGRATR